MILQWRSKTGPPQTSQVGVTSVSTNGGVAGFVASIPRRIGDRKEKMSVALLGLGLQVLQGHHRGVSARSSRHPASRMSTASTQVLPFDGGAVSGPSRDGSQGE